MTAPAARRRQRLPLDADRVAGYRAALEGSHDLQHGLLFLRSAHPGDDDLVGARGAREAERHPGRLPHVGSELLEDFRGWFPWLARREGEPISMELVLLPLRDHHPLDDLVFLGAELRMQALEPLQVLHGIEVLRECPRPLEALPLPKILRPDR